MSTKARSAKKNKAKSTKAKTAKSTKAKTAKSTKAKTAKSTKGRSVNKVKESRSSGILKGGAEVGIEKGDSTVGKINVGGEAGLKSDYSAGDFKEAADEFFDTVKSGVKAAKKKISNNL
jgi:hypothetical protein